MRPTETWFKHPPHALRRGNGLASISRTSVPDWAIEIAAAHPAGPAPIMMTSQWVGGIGIMIYFTVDAGINGGRSGQNALANAVGCSRWRR